MKRGREGEEGEREGEREKDKVRTRARVIEKETARE